MAIRATERMTRVRFSLSAMLMEERVVMLRKTKKRRSKWRKSRSRR